MANYQVFYHMPVLYEYHIQLFLYLLFIAAHHFIFHADSTFIVLSEKKSRSQTGNQSAAGGNRTHIAGVGVLCSIR